MLEAEFDRFAREYQESHAASIRLSGEAPDYFARYKIDDVAAALKRVGKTPRKILDFGSGVGNSIGPLKAAFPDAQIVALDPLKESLDIGSRRFPGQAEFKPFDGETIPFEAGTFDLVFAACVFHHIPHELHVALLAEIGRVTRTGGSVFIFEHNPWNPLTQHAVRNCIFDENAVLISAPSMKSRMVRAGLSDPRIRYRIFFPRVLAALRRLEAYLTGVPMGAQYFVHSIKQAA